MWVSARPLLSSATVLMCVAIQQHTLFAQAVTNATTTNATTTNETVATTNPDGTVGKWPTDLKASLKGDFTYAPYTPSDAVKKHSKNEFATNSDYMSSVVGQLMPLIIFGVLALFIFSTWSCATMQCCRKKKCCCAKCCGEPMKICQKGLVRTIVMVVGVIFAVCIFSVATAGLANETEQYDAIDGLGGILQVMVDWSDQTVTGINGAAVQVAGVKAASINMSTHSYKSSIGGKPVKTEIAKYGDLITGAMNETSTALKSINETAAATGDTVGSSKDDVDKAVKQMNDLRATFIETAYIVVVVMIILSVVLAGLKWLFPHKVGRSMRCCTGSFYCVYFLVLWICFIVAILLSLLTFVMADFCIDADRNFMDAMKLDSADDFAYYIQCDTNAALVNPLNKQSVEVLKSIDTASEQLDQLKVFETTLKDLANKTKDSTTRAGYLSDAKALEYNRVGLGTAITHLSASIGSNMTTLGFDSGLLSVLNCYSLNLRYNAVIWQMCDHVYNPMALSLEFCLTIFFMLVLTDWIRRWLRPTSDELGLQGGQVVPVNPKEQEQAYTGGEGGQPK